MDLADVQLIDGITELTKMLIVFKRPFEFNFEGAGVSQVADARVVSSGRAL